MKTPTPSVAGATTGGLPVGSFLPLLRRIGHEYARRVQNWGVPFPVISVLMEIHQHPGHAEPAVIADTLCMPRQTMTSLLDTLERRGLARRTPHPVDRRRKVLTLTDKGNQLAQDILEDAGQFEAQAMDAFPAKEVDYFREKILLYIEELTRQNDRAGHPKGSHA